MELPFLLASRPRGIFSEPTAHLLHAGLTRVRNHNSFLGSSCCRKFDCRRPAVSPKRAIPPWATEFTVVCDVSRSLPPSESSSFSYLGKRRELPSDATWLPLECVRPDTAEQAPSTERRKSSGKKKSVKPTSKDQLGQRSLSSVHSANVSRGSSNPSQAPTRASRRRHSIEIRAQAEVEEEARRQREVALERKAMAEANGFRLSKRSRRNPEEFQYLVKLNMCSKHGDLHGALELYDKLRTGEIFKLKQHYYNILLYICAGAASGSLAKGKGGKLSGNADDLEIQKPSEAYLEDRSEQADNIEAENSKDPEVVTFSQEERQLAARRGTEIYEDMVQAEIPLNEATFTAVARLAVAKGDGDLAFETVKKMTAANMVPKLRTYGPALLCFCEQNQIEKAFEVDEHMVGAGVLPDENLLEAMIRISSAAGLEAKVYTLLQRLRKTVREVSPCTVMTIERWFNSEAAAASSIVNDERPPSEEEIMRAAESRGGGWHGLGWLGEGKWKTTRTTISKTGLCHSCGVKLCAIDLDPEETEKFAKSVAELAMQRERNSNEFVTFQDWLKRNGQFEAIVDGANIGMFNSSHRGFNYNQVATVTNSLKTRKLIEKPPLIVLHRRRVSDGGSRSPRSQNMIESWVKDNALYCTPHGSNDDWYWLYAAVKCKCLLVTNDEMRDHLFQLLGNNFFPKWKERHQVRFTFSLNGLELLLPLPYSTIIQESETGSWHIPQSGGDVPDSSREWLCVTRSSTFPLNPIPLTTSQEQAEAEVVSNAEPRQLTREANVCSNPQLEPRNCFSKAIEERHVLSYSSKTLEKLDAAEALSMSAINFEI